MSNTCGDNPYTVMGYEASIEPMEQQYNYIATINYYFMMMDEFYLDVVVCDPPIQPYVYYDMR